MLMEHDGQIRQAAFAHCKALSHRFSGVVPWSAIEASFHIEGEHVFLAGKARRIHRPRQMQRSVLSIKTTRPRQGRTARYDDILGDDGYFSYAIEAKLRLHQVEFRERVLTAYGRRCAISGLPLPDLLEAAHIIPDRDQRARPEVSNGLCLSTLHHTAYDHNLLGIDPDGGIHIAASVLGQHDGPTLEQTI